MNAIVHAYRLQRVFILNYLSLKLSHGSQLFFATLLNIELSLVSQAICDTNRVLTHACFFVARMPAVDLSLKNACFLFLGTPTFSE